MYHYYIYFRVDPDLRIEADAAVKEIQYDLSQRFGLSAKLLKKRDEPLLWMEIYENVPSSKEFETALETSERQSNIRRCLIDGKRHIECFED